AYLPAKEVSADYEKAKGVIAHGVGAKASDLVITAGATEANNLAFTAITDGVLYLETEHDSVRRVAEQYGGQAIEVLPNGVIDLEDLKSKITDEVQMISVSLANNELGTIQPLAEIAAIIRKVKIDRMKRGVKTQLLLHSDASQALNLLDINVARLGVDLLTLNAAKVYGPKGVGALYVSHDASLSPLTVGGGQERGLRSGTENVPGVIGFAKAIELAKKHLNGNRKKYTNWRKILLAELKGYELINKKHVLDNFVVVSFPGLDAERLIFALEEKGVYVATGAACAASKGEKSHVLKAIGLDDTQIAGSLRITFGETNDETQIHEAAKIINEVTMKERARING
ncbi:aminotransferase class V-fold PLP-dependent enzyme, partial [Candidatus Saccharibacteria bacterium]|nr:aminotransferase class V-fold PLP-dependent enzyme [Candidatus Saccharibacteria bacterium]